MELLTEYIGDYDEVRTLLGVTKKELKDEDIERLVYRLSLSKALRSVSGVYGDSTDVRDLEQIFAAEEDGSEMKGLIQLYAIYQVAFDKSKSLSMFAPKTKSEGKGSVTRFSPESVYRDINFSLEGKLKETKLTITEMFSDYVEKDLNILSVAPPEINIVTNS